MDINDCKSILRQKELISIDQDYMYDAANVAYKVFVLELLEELVKQGKTK